MLLPQLQLLDPVLQLTPLPLQVPLLLSLLAQPQLALLLPHELQVPLQLPQPFLALGLQQHQLLGHLLLPQHLHLALSGSHHLTELLQLHC